MVSDKIGDNFMYQPTRAIHENLAALKEVHPVVKKETTLDRSTKGATFSIHPGAERYFREEGVLK